MGANWLCSLWSPVQNENVRFLAKRLEFQDSGSRALSQAQGPRPGRSPCWGFVRVCLEWHRSPAARWETGLEQPCGRALLRHLAVSLLLGIQTGLQTFLFPGCTMCIERRTSVILWTGVRSRPVAEPGEGRSPGRALCFLCFVSSPSPRIRPLDLSPSLRFIVPYP